MQTLSIVYHSMTDGTRQMADAAARGARVEPSMRVVMRHALTATAPDMLESSAYLFASPENLAAISGLMKDFFDRVYYPLLDRINGRPYALMICAGSDGSNAAQQMERIANGWRLHAIAPPLIVCTHAQTPEDILRPKVLAAADLQRCEELGGTLAAGAAMGIF